MDSITASRLTALLARKTGSEDVAEKIVAKVIEQLSRKAEPPSAEGTGTDRGRLVESPRFGVTGEGGPLGASHALRDGMKSGGKDSSELAFEEFIGAPVKSTDVAQNALPLNSATRALTALNDAFQSMSPDIRAAYSESVEFMHPDGYMGKVAPSVYLDTLSDIGGRQLRDKEEDGTLSTEDRDQIIAITGEIRDIFAQAEAAPDALIKKLVELEQAILKALGTEYLNP